MGSSGGSCVGFEAARPPIDGYPKKHLKEDKKKAVDIKSAIFFHNLLFSDGRWLVDRLIDELVPCVSKEKERRKM